MFEQLPTLWVDVGGFKGDGRNQFFHNVGDGSNGNPPHGNGGGDFAELSNNGQNVHPESHESCQ